ncbi:MAG: toprim domain-containing protein, partial [archaeon]
DEVREASRASEIQEWGPEKLPSGPEIEKETEIILVEGRADVINLLRNNVKNVIGMNGSKIPQSIIPLCQRKTVTLFTDGDRGGELIQRQLMEMTKVDFIARAPAGKEVEELTKKEITMALRKQIPAKDTIKTRTFPTTRPMPFNDRGQRNTPIRRDFGERSFNRPFERKPFNSMRNQPPTQQRFEPNYRPRTEFEPNHRPRTEFESSYRPRTEFVERRPLNIEARATDEEKKRFEPIINTVKGKMEAVLLDNKGKEIKKTKIRELVPILKEQKEIDSIILDGIITKRLIDEAKKHSVKYIIGIKKGKIEETPEIKTLIM